MRSDRAILFVADDYGIGPETSRGILELAETGRLGAAVLLTNTPYSQDAVTRWRRAGQPIELGWHPNLTLDRPLISRHRVRSLVSRTGQFWSLNAFILRASLGLIRIEHVALELQAQYDRFCEMTCQVPRLVNSHQHVALFGPVGRVLHDILSRQLPRPFFRRIRDSMATWRRVPGARFKRWFLTRRGRRLADESARRGFPGCDMLAGITNPGCVFDDRYFDRWLEALPDGSVEFMCHPGHEDETLIGRDCPAGPPVWRRTREYELMSRPEFAALVRFAGFRFAAVSDFVTTAAKQAA